MDSKVMNQTAGTGRKRVIFKYGANASSRYARFMNRFRSRRTRNGIICPDSRRSSTRVLPPCCGRSRCNPRRRLAGRRLHAHFREYALARRRPRSLFCPAYVLMPDHLHFLWLAARGEQSVGRHGVSPQNICKRSSPAARPRREYQLQKQSHERC